MTTSASAPARLLRTMLVIRRFEETLIRLAATHDIGHFHVYIGQEATGVPALAGLRSDDVCFTTHRNHGHLLARGVDPRAMFAEILGRLTGTNLGKGGTLHLASAAHGFPLTSSVTGGAFPLAVGAAFAFSRQRTSSISVCLTGDGALEEGTWHESANIAALERLPVVFLCENNSLEAVGQRANQYPSSTMATSPLTRLAETFGIPAEAVDGADAIAVAAAMERAVERARAGGGPSFVEARTVRWPGNIPLWPELATGETDLTMAWDPPPVSREHGPWFTSHDGVLRQVRLVVEGRYLSQDEVVALDADVREAIEVAAETALSDPYPDAAEAWTGVFDPKGV